MRWRWTVALGALALGALALAGCASGGHAPQPPAESEPPPPLPRKIDMWSGTTALRGACLWQTRVVREVYGDALGAAPLGPPVSQADLLSLASHGANLVVLSVPGVFAEDPPYALDENAQENLDALIAAAQAANLFVVISFRTGPGRSEFDLSPGESFEQDPTAGWFPQALAKGNVWRDEAAQEAWARMWTHTAGRYRSSRVILGYELMAGPNGESSIEGIDGPDGFYPAYAHTLADWNPFAAKLVAAVRQADPETPVLIQPMGGGSVSWLPYLEPIEDTRVVYTVRHYEPSAYAKQRPPLVLAYPSETDWDGDGQPESLDRASLSALLDPLKSFKTQVSAPMAVTEFGAMRWEPGLSTYLRDQMIVMEQNNLAHAVWMWPPSSLAGWGEDAFALTHGPDPNQHSPVGASAALNVLQAQWALNQRRPSNTSFQ